ncbi:MAG: CARDB domain-containing protein [Candidatus Curtissbacteria bacterium]|nr:CARDB domain-containing protein [Candidatus Curtissbacteria bacterium]
MLKKAFLFFFAFFAISIGSVFAQSSSSAPAAPTIAAPQVSCGTNSSGVNINWTDNSNNENGFEVWTWKTGSDPTRLTTVGANTTSATWSGAPISGDAAVYVVAYNSSGRSVAGPRDFPINCTGGNPAQPAVAKPEAPVNITFVATCAGGGMVTYTVAWSENSSNVEGFVVYGWQNGDGNWTPVGNFSPTIRSATWGPLVSVLPVAVAVGARRSGQVSYGEIKYIRDSSCGATMPANPAVILSVPAAPSNISTVVSCVNSFSSNVNITWKDNSDNENAFYVLVAKDGDSLWTRLPVTGPNVQSAIWSGAPGSGKAYVLVFSSNAAGSAPNPALTKDVHEFSINCAGGGTGFNPSPGAGSGGAGGPADLVIDSVSFSPSTVQEGQAVSFSALLRNAGSGTANPSSTRLRIDFDSNGTWDFTSGFIPTSFLAAGGTQTISWNNIWTAVVGNHKVEVCADATGVVNESNNDNNCKTEQITVGRKNSFGALVPSAPSNVRAEGISCGGFGSDLVNVKVTWADNSNNENQFLIWIWQAGDPGWSVLGTVGAGAGGTLWNGVRPGDAAVAVVAVNAAGGTPSDIYNFKATCSNMTGR